MKAMNSLKILFVLTMFSTMLFAISGLNSAVTALCSGVRGLLPIVSFLMIVCAGVVYAAGQILGAETRARASVWATAMLIGALIGIIIVVVTPSILSALYSGTYSC